MNKTKNKAAQSMQKLSWAKQIKNLGSKENIKKDMGKRAKKRWDKVRLDNKAKNTLSPV